VAEAAEHFNEMAAYCNSDLGGGPELSAFPSSLPVEVIYTDMFLSDHLLCSLGAEEEMWIDAGRTCDLDPDNRRIDWENGTVTVKASTGRQRHV